MEKFYPTSVLVTGYDILFFWVARMVILGLFATEGKVPFHTIALHGLVRDRFGKKMSKSRGNTVDPIEFMDKYGSDALRFTLARGANPGTDQAIAEEWIGGSRNFATKLWNATRFAIMNGATVAGEMPKFESLDAINKWILTRLDETIFEVDELFEKFEFAKACELIYHFAWDDLCDWYLELSKANFQAGDVASKRVLGHVLDQLLRLMHPAMPFITEELWCSFTGGETLVTANWPKANPSERDESAKVIVAKLQELVTEIRRFRNDQGIKTTAKVAANFNNLGDLSSFEPSLRNICKLEAMTSTASANIEVAGVKVDFDLTGAIDVAAERARLSKDLSQAQKDQQTAKVKLDNEGFMAKAPIEVVQEIRERLAQTSADIERISALLASLPK
jgi:valyl-tRNA synthetase